MQIRAPSIVPLTLSIWTSWSTSSKPPTYKSTAQRLLSLLENGEITYNLLLVLFKPNSMVYSTCFGTEKPRCVIYDDGEEGETSNGLKYYKMECQYLDYDGYMFGESPIHLAVVKFRGRKRISTLNAFPL